MNVSSDMDFRDRITIEPGKRGGKPCILGLRITVSDILEYLAGGMSEDAILASTTTPATVEWRWQSPPWPRPTAGVAC